MTGGKCTQLDIKKDEAADMLRNTVAATILEQIGGKELMKGYYREYVEGYEWVKNHYDHIKEIHKEQFQADFVIVTTKKNRVLVMDSLGLKHSARISREEGDGK